MKLELPTQKKEDWRFTDLSRLNLEDFHQETTLPKISLQQKENHLVFINGLYCEYSSTLKEIHKKKILLVPKGDFILNLNKKFSSKELNLTIPDHTKQTIHITHIITKEHVLAAPTLSIEIGASSQVNIFEEFENHSKKKSLSVPVISFILKENANITHVSIQDQKSKESLHLAKALVVQQKDSSFNSFVLNSKSSSLCRNEILVNLNETGAISNLYGLYNISGNAHAANYITINHDKEKTYSKTHYNGVLDENAHAVFRGRVAVKRNAQKIESIQTNKNLMLGKNAKVNSLPQLEIDADDVKCGHGSTIGQVNEEELFYLQSRGIPKKQAKQMICEGFCLEPMLELNSDAKAFIKQFL